MEAAGVKNRIHLPDERCGKGLALIASLFLPPMNISECMKFLMKVRRTTNSKHRAKAPPDSFTGDRSAKDPMKPSEAEAAQS